MKYVVIVDDSRFFCKLLTKRLEKSLPYRVVSATSYGEALKLIDSIPAEQIEICLADYRLPDAQNGEIVELLYQKSISTVVMISDITREIRYELWKKRIVDYVIKSDKGVPDDIIKLLKRLRKNAEVKIALIDDSEFSSNLYKQLLEIHRFEVLQFECPIKAWEYLKCNNDIKILLVDYHMPGLNGCELTKKVRRLYSKESMVILGISSDKDDLMSVNFLKHGADDFLIKQNILAEEFYARVTEYAHRLEVYQQLKETATRDFLTGVGNRRHFFSKAHDLHQHNIENNIPYAFALIDIDNFKLINDSYGHHVGDSVIVKVAQVIRDSVKGYDLTARFGGEEFCVYLSDISAEDTARFFEKLRVAIENSVVETEGGNRLSVTVSIGVCTENNDSLDTSIKAADQLLYSAKNQGRNKVVTSLQSAH